LKIAVVDCSSFDVLGILPSIINNCGEFYQVFFFRDYEEVCDKIASENFDLLFIQWDNGSAFKTVQIANRHNVKVVIQTGGGGMEIKALQERGKIKFYQVLAAGQMNMAAIKEICETFSK